MQGALELAFSRARRDAADGPPPPAPLRPVLRFTRLPRRALRTVAEVLDSDEEFRRRVAEHATEDDLDRASWLFLTRPEGWREELELLRSAATEELEDQRASREEQRAERRVAQLSDALERLREEMDVLRAALAEAERSAAEERSKRAALERDQVELKEQIAQLEVDRTRAVRSLKDTEATAAARLEELREVRGQLIEALDASAAAPAEEPPPEPIDEPTAEPTTEAWPGDTDAIARAVKGASEAAEALSVALAEAASALGTAASPDTDQGSGAAGPTASAAAPSFTATRPDLGKRRPVDGPSRPPRRTPIRLRQGVHEDSVEGLLQLLGTPGVLVVVDGYNVTKKGWPNLEPTPQRSTLLSGLATVRARTGANVHVVFDGDAEGGRPAVTAPLPVRVHFSPEGTEADDVILEMVAGVPTDVPVVVISSDRRVADGARRLGANAVRSEQLLALLRR